MEPRIQKRGAVHYEPAKQILCGDLNSDSKVNIFDLIIVAKAYGSMPGDSNWDPVADANEDSQVDIFDLVIVVRNFGKSIQD